MANAGKRLRLTQKRSPVGGTLRQRRTLKGLGLGRIGRSAVAQDRPEIRGMVAKVRHLVVMEELTDERDPDTR